MVKFLLSQGANPSIKDRFDRTPADIARQYSVNDKVVDLLESKSKNKRAKKLGVHPGFWSNEQDPVLLVCVSKATHLKGVDKKINPRLSNLNAIDGPRYSLLARSPTP